MEFELKVVKSPNKGLAIFTAVVIGFLLVLLAGSSYWEEMSTITDTSESTGDMRLELWRIAVREFLAYPVTGVGPGNYHWRMSEFQSADQMIKYGRIMAAEVHSTYFQLLAELGLAGCFVFGMVLVRMVRDYLFIGDLSQESRAPVGAESDHPAQEDILWINAYRNGLMGGILGYLTSVAFLSGLYYSHLWIAVSMMSALFLISSQMIKVN